jgi:hypothetical protein
MLFFFEAAFFVLAIAALALGEFWGRSQALILWAALTVTAVIARPLARRRLSRAPPADRAEAQWRRALVDSWWHLNKLLLLGLAALTVWWWLGTNLR